MRYFLFLALFLSGCTSMRVNTVDYCHSAGGTFRDNAECNKDPKPITLERQVDKDQDR